MSFSHRQTIIYTYIERQNEFGSGLMLGDSQCVPSRLTVKVEQPRLQGLDKGIEKRWKQTLEVEPPSSKVKGNLMEEG